MEDSLFTNTLYEYCGLPVVALPLLSSLLVNESEEGNKSTPSLIISWQHSLQLQRSLAY